MSSSSSMSLDSDIDHQPTTRSFTANIITALSSAGLAHLIPSSLIRGPLPPPTRRPRQARPPMPSHGVLPAGCEPYFDTTTKEWRAIPAEMKAEMREKERKEKVARERKRGLGREGRVKRWKRGGLKGKGVDNGDGGRWRVGKGMEVPGKKDLYSSNLWILVAALRHNPTKKRSYSDHCLISTVDGMGDPLGTATSIIAIIQLTVQVVTYLKNVKGGSDDRTRLRDEIRSTTSVLQMLQDRIEDDDDDDEDDEGNEAEEKNQAEKGKEQAAWRASVRSLDVPNGPLSQFKQSLESIVEKLAPAGGLEKLKRKFAWPFDHDTIKEILQVIERQKSLFNLALANDHFNLSLAIKQDVGSIGKTLRDQEEKRDLSELLAWLSDLDFEKTHSDYFAKREAGTGVWVLETLEFRQWIQGLEQKTLWCRGIAGAGKTIVASGIIDHLQHTMKTLDTAVSYVYCNYKQQEQQTVSQILACITKQLIAQLGKAPFQVAEGWRDYKVRGTRPGVEKIHAWLQTIVSFFSNVFIVLDALDECEDINGTRTSVVQYLQKLPKISLLCTSRPLGHTSEILRGCPVIEIKAHPQDVEKYLKARIKQSGRLEMLVRNNKGLKETIIQKVLEKTEGMFLLAQLHVDALNKLRTQKEVRKALDTLPVEVFKTYDQAILRIRDQGKGDFKLAESVIGWITFARAPLQVEAVQQFIALSDADAEQPLITTDDIIDENLLVNVCAGLVAIDEQSSIIRLVHETAQTYFETDGSSLFSNYQAYLARACIRCFDSRKLAMCKCSKHKAIRGEFAMENVHEPLNPSLALEYSAWNWSHHALEAPESEVLSEILALFNSSRIVNAYGGWSGDTIDFLCPQDDTKNSIQPFWGAVFLGLSETTAVMIKSGVSVDAEKTIATTFWETPLRTAAKNGYAAVVSTLLSNGAKIGYRDGLGWTPLHNASANGHVEIVQELVEWGAIVNDADSHGYTSVHLAAIYGHQDIVEVLVSFGADVEMQNENGKTASELASQYGHQSIVDFLVSHVANLEKGARGVILGKEEHGTNLEVENDDKIMTGEPGGPLDIEAKQGNPSSVIPAALEVQA
ncbi:hypothetical protein EG329_004201 [Mollisiaceae sp. DMI_Dod_QoI]|nr:hypothetical protein EG329_004201 [Helotiales sp. DMI_Dod_QoI]